MPSIIFLYGGAILSGAAVFFGIIGVYETFLRRFFEEVSEQGEESFVVSLRKLVLRRLGLFNRGFMSVDFEVKMQKKLVMAGDPADLKPEEIIAFQEVAAVAGLALGLYVTLMTGLDLGLVLAISLALAIFGWLYPLMWVRDQIAARHLEISRALPYNLDLLTLSVEAGLDFTGALGKVVEKGRDGALKEEFALVLRQLKMGKTREEALRSTIDRCNLPSLTSFLTSLIQADRMGTSLGKVLRIQSTQLRIERTQRAEKLANEAPVKMLFPLIACIFPTVFMVLFGPIVFQFVYGGVGQ